MRIVIQKAITNPLRIMGVPYGLALLNFAVFFAIFIISLIITGGAMNPVYFLFPFLAVHYVLSRIARAEPQLGSIIAARLKTLKIPKDMIG